MAYCCKSLIIYFHLDKIITKNVKCSIETIAIEIRSKQSRRQGAGEGARQQFGNVY